MKHANLTPTDIYNTRANQDDFLHLEDISPNFVIFVLLLEDCSFFNHKRGYDFRLIWSAFCSQLFKKGEGYGGSTITTQLVKNLYFTFERRLKRKFLELFYAADFEKHLTKKQILELYINTIYYDNGQYGIMNASRFYFHREPSELTDNQAFFLASLLPVVGLYNPLYHPEQFVKYRNRRLHSIPYAERVLPKTLVEEILRHGPDCLDEDLCKASQETDRYNAPGPLVNERFGPGGWEPLAMKTPDNEISRQQQLVLEIISDALFSGSTNTRICEEDIITELIAQAVLPLANLQDNEVWQRLSASIIAKNMRNFYEYSELHDLLSSNNIPYVILKGIASASYYPDPILRTMGDIDFLIRPSDIPKATELLSSAGFVSHNDDEAMHISFRRNDSLWEMHYTVKGVPETEAGLLIQSYLSDIIETAVDYDNGDCSIKIPDDFHHGLVLLLHMAFHFSSSTGIGLRHLCDWAVFVCHFTDAEFISIFEERLKACGLWRFAQILTLTSVRYLHQPRPSWVADMDEAFIRQVISDILSGGNFGRKDPDRAHQIEYIADVGKNTLNQQPAIIQLLLKIKTQADSEGKTIFYVIRNRLFMLLSGEWKPSKNIALVKQVTKRKKIYSDFHLFEP